MSRRLSSPPDPISRAAAVVGRADRSGLRGWQLVRGEVLAFAPRGARPIAELLPYNLGAALGKGEAVATRVDIEDDLQSFQRPELERFERGRDFYIADGSGHALVHLSDENGRLQDRVELHLEGGFRTHRIEPTGTRAARTVYLRALRVGQPVYLMGRVRVEPDASGIGGPQGAYREAPLHAVFAGDASALHLYDEAAFHQIAAWHALPWYRKLSVLVRNR